MEYKALDELLEEEYNTLDELLDSKEFKDFMDELEDDGFFDQFEDEEDGNTLADTGRYPEK